MRRPECSGHWQSLRPACAQLSSTRKPACLPACLPANQWGWSWDLRCCWGPQGLGQWGLDAQARQPKAGVRQGFASLSTLRGCTAWGARVETSSGLVQDTRVGADSSMEGG